MESSNASLTSLMTTFAKLELTATKEIPLWFSILFASINGVGFCLNTLSLWLLAARKFVYRYTINAFVVSLCVSDFIVSLASFNFLATLNVDGISKFSKRVATIILGFSLETSLLSVFFLSLERFVTICKPFRYSEILSKIRVTCILLLGWMFCFGLLGVQVVFGFVYKNHQYVYINWIVFICLLSSSIIVVVVVNTYEVHRHSLHIKLYSIFLHPAELGESTCNYTASDLKAEVTLMGNSCSANPSLLTKRKQFIKEEKLSIFSCFSIVLVFFVSWLPVIVYIIQCIVSNTCDDNNHLLFVSLCLVSLNTLLNPLFYFILNREVKDFLFRELCKITSRSASQTANSNLRKTSNII